jgi:hypothetical protein
LTPCCGLEVQKHTQALKSVKGQGNTLIFEKKFVEGGGGSLKYHMKNILRTAEFLPTWGLNQDIS